MAFIEPDIAETVANLPGVTRAVYETVLDASARAKATLAARRDTGNSYIDVTRGDVDSFLNLNDPGGHAGAIEFGRSGTGRTRPDGSRKGASQGVFAITGAF